VTDWVKAGEEDHSRLVRETAEVTAGLLVHRIIQSARQLEALPDSPAQLAFVRSLLSIEEVAELDDLEACVVTALATWHRLRTRLDISELFEAPERQHEVPCSLQSPAGILRGIIDCLIRKSDGTLVVLEFKTGAPRPSDQIQLDLYVRAVEHMFPDAAVEGRLVYL
jgi:ATP-dependent exoDNAse (exonuclease V) beta subunit